MQDPVALYLAPLEDRDQTRDRELPQKLKAAFSVKPDLVLA